MKIKTIRFENFRQFYDKQPPIKFSDIAEKNVILIFGANGAGKSALLNGFTWTLYNKTTPALEDPDNLICEKAISEADIGEVVEARVKIEFEHEGQQYIATRIRQEKKIGEPMETNVLKEGELKLKIINLDGESETSEHPSDRLDKVLPERLHSFFFFDGERIEELAKESAYHEIEEAIKNILGLTILERAITHLNGTVKRRLDEELSDIGTEETKELINQIQELEDQRKSIKTELENEYSNLSASQEGLEEVKNQRRSLDETKRHQEKLDSLDERKEEIKTKLGDIKNEIKVELNRNGYSAFLQPVIDKCHDVLEEKRKKGEIPSDIKKQFVQDLLDTGECICGKKLEKDSEHYKNVKSWLGKAGRSEIEEESVRVGVQLKGLTERRENLFSNLKSLQTEQEEQRTHLKKTNERISEVDHKMNDMDSEKVQDLVERIDQLEQQIKDINESIGRYKEKIKNINEELEELEGKKEKAEVTNKRAKKLKNKLKIRQEAALFFEKLFEQKSDQVRKALDHKVKDVYQEISYKNYWPEITKDYRLTLKKGISNSDEQVNKSVAKSTGENQVLSLSFIGSVASYARDLAEKKDSDEIIDFEGGIYPIVMDSPFGALDENYREAIARGIPKLTNQVGIIVSKSQGLGVVLNTLKTQISKAYVLTYYTPKKQGEETLSYEGHSYPYIVKSEDQSEWAEIKEIG